MATDLAQTPEFQQQLGLFYAAWSSTELMLDYAIGKLLKLPHEQTHVLTSGMDYGRKIRLLKQGWAESGSKNKGTVIGCLNYFRNTTKRNVFAHSFMITSSTTVVFIERGYSEPYYVKDHPYTKEKFAAHVGEFIEKGRQFREALDIDVASQDFRAFRDAALSLIRSDSKSHDSAEQPKSKT